MNFLDLLNVILLLQLLDIYDLSLVVRSAHFWIRWRRAFLCLDEVLRLVGVQGLERVTLYLGVFCLNLCISWLAFFNLFDFILLGRLLFFHLVQRWVHLVFLVRCRNRFTGQILILLFLTLPWTRLFGDLNLVVHDLIER